MINAFHPAYVETYMPEFMSTIRKEAIQRANGTKFGGLSRATRESVHGSTVNTINVVPKTKKRVSTAVTEFHIYSKAGAPKVKK
mgnify:CR=1 FL=1